MITGFYLMIGKQGSGKTAFTTKHIMDARDEVANRKVFCNYELYNIPHTRITFNKDPNDKSDTLDILEQLKTDPNFFNNSIMVLDEIHVYLDSLDFMKKNNRSLHSFFSQLRKRKIYLLATTQYLLNVDVRVRRQLFNVFEMKHVKGCIFQASVHEVDGYYSEYIRSDYYDLSNYFSEYDTNEVIT